MSVTEAGVPNTSSHPSYLPRLFCLKFHHCQRATLWELQPISLGGNLTLAHWCPLASFLIFFGRAANSSQIRKYKSTLWRSRDLPLGTGARKQVVRKGCIFGAQIPALSLGKLRQHLFGREGLSQSEVSRESQDSRPPGSSTQIPLPQHSGPRIQLRAPFLTGGVWAWCLSPPEASASCLQWDSGHEAHHGLLCSTEINVSLN